MSSIENIKAPEALKKSTALLFNSEKSTAENKALNKSFIRKTVVIAAVITLLGATTVYAEDLFRIFRAANGSSVLYSESENETAVTFDNISTDYAAVINERLYFVLGDIQKDVTDV